MQETLQLQQLGLTEIEAKVYLHLLKLGSTKTGPLVKKTELHRATVYDVLKRLMEKGLVSFITKEKTKYFEATTPLYLLNKIEEEKKTLQEKMELTQRLIKDLEKIKAEGKQVANASIFQGIPGVKTMFTEILSTKEYWVIGSRGKFKEVLGEYYEIFQKRKKFLKIQSKILLSESLRNSEYTKPIYGEIKYLPKEFDSPISTYIYKNKVSIILFIEPPTLFMLENEALVKSYKQYFDLLWKRAKR